MRISRYSVDDEQGGQDLRGNEAGFMTTTSMVGHERVLANNSHPRPLEKQSGMILRLCRFVLFSCSRSAPVVYG